MNFPCASSPFTWTVDWERLRDAWLTRLPTLFGTRSEGTISAKEVEPQTQEKELLTTSTPPRVDHDGQVRCTLNNRPAGGYDELTIYAKTLKIDHTNSALGHSVWFHLEQMIGVRRCSSQ